MTRLVFLFGLMLICWPLSAGADQATVDKTDFDSSCGVTIAQEGEQLVASWPASGDATGVLRLNLLPGKPLLQSLQLVTATNPKPPAIIEGADPVVLLTVGERDLSTKGGWVIFFDNPNARPHQTFRTALDKRSVRISSQQRRATIEVGELTAGPFRGDFWITLYPGSDLLRSKPC